MLPNTIRSLSVRNRHWQRHKKLPNRPVNCDAVFVPPDRQLVRVRAGRPPPTRGSWELDSATRLPTRIFPPTSHAHQLAVLYASPPPPATAPTQTRTSASTHPPHWIRRHLRWTPNCTTLSLIPTVNGNAVRSFYYARTTVRSPRKLNHGLTRGQHPINLTF